MYSNTIFSSVFNRSEAIRSGGRFINHFCHKICFCVFDVLTKSILHVAGSINGSELSQKRVGSLQKKVSTIIFGQIGWMSGFK